MKKRCLLAVLLALPAVPFAHASDKIMAAEPGKWVSTKEQRAERLTVKKQSVAMEYIELGKLRQLNAELANAYVNLNISIASACGLTLGWQELFDDSQFRQYTQAGGSSESADKLAESLCRKEKNKTMTFQ